MPRIFALAFLFFWCWAAYALWLDTVVDAKSAIEFMCLTLPPTVALVFSALLANRFAL